MRRATPGLSRHRRRRSLLLPAGALALVLTTLVGCDLMVAQVTPRPSRDVATPEPTLEPSPTEIDEVPTLPPDDGDQTASLVATADALTDLSSYRITVRCRGLVPATPTTGVVTMTSTQIQGDDPRATFTMSGVDGFAGGRLQAVVIGDEAWLKEGTGAWTKSPGGAADFDAAYTPLSPSELLATFEDLAPLLARVGLERKNGQRTVHERITASDPGASDAGLATGSLDVWREATKGYLVSLVLDGTSDLDGDGAPDPVVLRIDVTHVGDAANRVSAPG